MFNVIILNLKFNKFNKFVSGANHDNWIELVYGTISGKVVIVVYRPETAGSENIWCKTFSVHNHPISKVMLTSNHLISSYYIYNNFYNNKVCCHSNHVKTWSITRFREIISTQPGPIPLASFDVNCLIYENENHFYEEIGIFIVIF